MPRDFLHNHPQFADLIRIVADREGIANQSQVAISRPTVTT
jgi:hypothetical protein